MNATETIEAIMKMVGTPVRVSTIFSLLSEKFESKEISLAVHELFSEGKLGMSGLMIVWAEPSVWLDPS